MSTDKPAAKASEKSSSKLRTSILLGILLVALAVAGYDRFVAMKARDEMATKMQSMINDTTTSYFKDDVSEMFDKQPELHVERGKREIYKYSWPRGIPFLTFDYYVEYQEFQGKMALRNGHIEVPPDDRYDDKKHKYTMPEGTELITDDLITGGQAPTNIQGAAVNPADDEAE